jgi:hypothetical protein
MVTGFLTLAIGIYQSNTRDDCYTKKDSLNMQITDKMTYKKDLHALYKALVHNWDDSKFVLYPCEVSCVDSGESFLIFRVLLLIRHSLTGSTACVI